MIIDEQALLRLIDERVERALAERQPPEETMFKHEVASLLDVSERTVTNYMREGLPHRYRGRTPVFLRSEVLAWHREHGRKPLRRSA